MSLPPIRAALAEMAARLRAAGVPDPAADARRLIAAAVGVDPSRIGLIGDDRLTPEQSARLDDFVTRRTARQPVAQIVGWRDFWKHRFTVTPDTLDPRPDTEALVAEALRLPWDSVLDLGTGTGAILISLLADRPGARGMGVDLSPAALEVARINAKRLGVAAEFTLSDWFTGVTSTFDLIVSNPPYIAADEMPGLDPDVREHEPRMALTDEADGLSAYRAIAAGAGAHLAPGGWLAVEIGPTQAEEVSAIFAAAGWADIAVRADLDGRARVVVARARFGTFSSF